MSTFYTNVSVSGNYILYRGYENGKRVQYRHEYFPKVYVKSNKPNTEWKNLFGQRVEEVQPGTIRDTRDFIKRYDDVDNFEVYGDIGFDVQYISDNFSNVVDWNINDIGVYVLDIETATEESGFPNPDFASEEVLLITLMDLRDKSYVTFMSRDYKGKRIPKGNIIMCNDEYDLLVRFVDYWANHINIDIITGWNVEGFDIKYLVNRIGKVVSDEKVKQLSPWGRVNTVNTKDDFGKSTTLYDIIGISVIDYRDLYKKYGPGGKQENYRLETICQAELGVGKLDHSEFDTFKEFYTYGWDKFCDYNTIDCERIVDLNQKMKLIELCLTMSFLAKINFGDVFSQIRMWDAIIYNHLRAVKIVIPPKSKASKNEQFEGAYVREPIPGFYDWISSFDATSLYPSIIQAWNISLETFVGMYDEDIDLKKLMNRQYRFDSRYTVAANGAMYSREKKGVLPELIDVYMKKRKEAKSEMLKYESELEALKSIKGYSKEEYSRLQNLISKYNNEQMAFKIAMNSLYGALGNAFFRYYTLENARAITLSGQYIIISVGDHVKDKLDSLFKMKYPWVIYQDTDSIYLTLAPIIDKFYKDREVSDIIPVLSKICKEKIDPIINECCDRLQNYTNTYRKCINFKLEAISSKGFWVAKKRYALNVYENEGVVYSTPKLKIMGLQVVQSSTPKVIRDELRQSISLILNGTEEQVQDFVTGVKSKFHSYSVEEIACPRSVNGMDKYSNDKSVYVKGTPINTKGSLLYNHKLKELGLHNKYQSIGEGDSIKYCYLKMPNPMKDSVVAFPVDLPKEFNLHQYVDYETQYEKVFLMPLNGMLEAVGWSHEKRNSIEDFFS